MKVNGSYSKAPIRNRAKAIAISAEKRKADALLVLSSALLLGLLLLGAGRLIGP